MTSPSLLDGSHPVRVVPRRSHLSIEATLDLARHPGMRSRLPQTTVRLLGSPKRLVWARVAASEAFPGSSRLLDDAQVAEGDGDVGVTRSYPARPLLSAAAGVKGPDQRIMTG